MRVAFVVPRFGTDTPTAPERLAEELASAGSKRWQLNVLTVASGERKGRTLTEGMVQVGKFRVHRFAADGSEAPDQLTSAALTGHLSAESYDAVVLFGATAAVCREAARAVAERTVLLPFTPEQPGETDRELFERAGAFVFGSEAEEVRALKQYGVHRRMRETVDTGFLMPRDLNPDGFRQRVGIRGRHLLCGDSAESDRVVQEFVRLFHSFRDSHPRAQLDLVVLGAAPSSLPRRPDTRYVVPEDAAERLDAIAGALMMVLPGRLTGVSATVEPFSLGVPILVHGSADDLVARCQQSNGGLWYRDYTELELILQLGLADPDLFGRLGEAGRNHLMRHNDWEALAARYDQAIRSFARPSRVADEVPPPPPEPPPEAEPADDEKDEGGLPRFFRGTLHQD